MKAQSHVSEQHPTRRSVLRSVAAVGVVPLAVCHQVDRSGTCTINSFTVSPTIICPGREVTVTWDIDVEDDVPPATLTVQRNGRTDEFTVERGGSRTFTVDTDTEFRLEREGCATWTRTVRLIPDGETREFTFTAFGQCVGGRPWWFVNIVPDEVDDRTQIVSVQNPNEKTIRVAHGVSSTSINPGGNDGGVFSGRSALGQWAFRSVDDPFSVSFPCRSDEEFSEGDLGTLSLVLELECE